jgi:hypothetical protein
MNGSRFDEVSRFFARRRLSRRRTVLHAAAGLAAAGLTAGLATASAQDAAPDAEQGPEMLFLQSFQSGAIVSEVGKEGRYTVTLERGLGQTIYFSDRPERVVGASPTSQFLKGLGFLSDNPPNAALVVENAFGDTDIAVVELFNPRYDPAGPTLTYEATVLADWEKSIDLDFETAPVDLAAFVQNFGPAHIFIDGCPDGVITCLSDGGNAGSFPSSLFGGFCYSPSDNVCLPCKPWHAATADAFGIWREACNAQFPKCAGACEPLGVSRLEK